MNDCVNAEIRDQLPDLVHDRLNAAARARVLAHVDGCGDCRDELELLRDVRTMFARGVPHVDVAYVVGALPKAPAARRAVSASTRAIGSAATPLTLPGAVPAARRARSWSDWRIAAAVTLLLAGGGSFAVLSSHRGMPADSVAATGIAMTGGATTAVAANANPGATVDSAPGLGADVDIATLVAPDDDRPAAVGSMDARLGDLSVDQLNALLNDMDNLRAIPAGDPEPVSLRDARTTLEDM